MQQDRRETDKIILEELRDLKQDVKRIDINLALNTQKTTELAEYQKFQNGRLGTIESRTQIVEGAQAITSTAVAKIQDKENKQDDNKEDWVKYLIKAAIWIGALLFYYLLIKNGFPNFLH